ncbi:MAG: malonyl-CoA decarboxylase domain-containing protein [Terriglobales bacterium]
MPQFLTTLLNNLRGARGADMRLLCTQLLSQRGEATQTVLAQRILERYKEMNSDQQLEFFRTLALDFNPDQARVQHALEQYARGATPAAMAALYSAVESPRQELFRRINTGLAGTETLVGLRRDLLRLLPHHPELAVVDADLKHLFRSWFNRGFLRMEQIGWQTSAITLEKLIEYEAVHEIKGWPDLRRRLEADRRCFAFFHPSLAGEPIIFVEVALTRGLARHLEPLLDINEPVLPPEKADTAIFYSINNCLDGLRGIPFGNFLIKHVVDQVGAELPKIKSYSTLSPVPHLARALHAHHDPHGFTRARLGRLMAEFAADLNRESGISDPVESLLLLLKKPAEHQQLLEAPLRRVTVAYLTQFRAHDKSFDPVAAFHFSNGARLEAVNPFANVRPYGLRDSFGVMVNYRYVPDEVEENHEAFVTAGERRVSSALSHDVKTSEAVWRSETTKEKRGQSAD